MWYSHRTILEFDLAGWTITVTARSPRTMEFVVEDVRTALDLDSFEQMVLEAFDEIYFYVDEL